MVLVGASSDTLSAAEVGRVLLAIWGLVHALLHAGARCSQDKVVNAVDSGQCLHGYQRAAGTGGGSRQVRPPLSLDCRLGGRRYGPAQENPLRNAECRAECH